LNKIFLPKSVNLQFISNIQGFKSSSINTSIPITVDTFLPKYSFLDHFVEIYSIDNTDFIIISFIHSNKFFGAIPCLIK
jgi:hypothetical protein